MPTQPDSTELSLYKRLGGYDVIAAVIADMFGLMRADPRFSRFNQGRSIDSKCVLNSSPWNRCVLYPEVRASILGAI